MSVSSGLGRRRIAIAAASAAVMLVSGLPAHAAFDVVEKNIPQLEAAYANGDTTVSDVVNQYLNRIATYDDGARGVNAVGQINPALSAAVAQAQALIAGGATTAQYPLLGVPVLVKDSYDVSGMITTNGVSILNGDPASSLSTTLIAKSDNASVAALKAAGAIILGKTNMSTMAYSTFGLDNAHGVVRNPYNYNRAPGGSSSGSGAAEAANFAMLTMGGETGGSIRIPSAYNGIVGLKTSAGLVSPNGAWPLTPTRDVVGPMGKTVADMAYAMNALARTTSDNIWNGTPYYPTGGPQPGAVGSGLGEGTDPTSRGLTAVTGTRPVDYTAFLSGTALQGKTLIVPSSVVRAGATNTRGYEATFNTAVYDNFQAQLDVLKARGANVVTNVDIPAEVLYFNTIGNSTTRGGSGAAAATVTGFVDKNGAAIPYPTTTVGGTTPSSTWSSNAAAFYYEKQIEGYGDAKIKNLRDFANALSDGSAKGAGSPFATLASSGAATSIASLATIWEAGNAKGFADADGDGSPDNPDAIKALAAFTTLRQQYVNDWLTDNGYDAIIEPSMSGLAGLQAAALQNGKANVTPGTNGNGAHNARFLGNILGLPALSVPSGTLGGDENLWTGLQFIGRLDSEAQLLGMGYDYQNATNYRFAPDLTAFVPEPASLAAAGLVGVVMLRRRRQPGRQAAQA